MTSEWDLPGVSRWPAGVSALAWSGRDLGCGQIQADRAAADDPALIHPQSLRGQEGRQARMPRYGLPGLRSGLPHMPMSGCRIGPFIRSAV